MFICIYVYVFLCMLGCICGCLFKVLLNIFIYVFISLYVRLSPSLSIDVHLIAEVYSETREIDSCGYYLCIRFSVLCERFVFVILEALSVLSVCFRADSHRAIFNVFV